MFCSTECWNCNDRTCKHYISKFNLYFENRKLQQRIDKTIEYLKNNKNTCYFEEDINNLLEILKGDSNE